MNRLPTSQGVRRLLASLLFCAILAAVLAATSAVLKPGRSLDKGQAGAAWKGYLAQPQDSLDVVFFGTSHVFDGVDPSTVWKRRGIAGYVMAGPAQKLGVTEYYVREALRTQRPKVVVVDLGAVDYPQARFDQAFHAINIGYMPWGRDKLAAGVFASPSGQRVGALVDLWNYHSRWSQITREDLNLGGKNGDGGRLMKGWQAVTTSKPVSATPEAIPADAARLAAVDYNAAAVRRIAEMTHARGIPLVITLMPISPPGGNSGLLERVGKPLAAEFDNVSLLDLSLPGAVPGLSYQSDFFDKGHLSAKGAEKASAALANFLADKFGLADHRGDSAYSAWETDVVRSRERVQAATK
jgi:hypothetical protein